MQQCAEIYFLRLNPKNIVLVTGHLSLGQAVSVGLRLLDKYNLKSRVKQLMRSF